MDKVQNGNFGLLIYHYEGTVVSLFLFPKQVWYEQQYDPEANDFSKRVTFLLLEDLFSSRLVSLVHRSSHICHNGNSFTDDSSTSNH